MAGATAILQNNKGAVSEAGLDQVDTKNFRTIDVIDSVAEQERDCHEAAEREC